MFKGIFKNTLQDVNRHCVIAGRSTCAGGSHVGSCDKSRARRKRQPRYNRKHTGGHRVMEHKAGLRARFVRNSIGGGSHDPRNWIGCVSRREETTTASPPPSPRSRIRKATARKRDDLIAVCADTDRESDV